MTRFCLNPGEIGRNLSAELAVVMPVFNEQDTIQGVLREWNQVLQPLVSNFVFIIVNDGSTDATQAKLEQLDDETPDRYLLIYKPNSGHGNSCRVGYDIAATGSCQWVLQIDSDGQCDPKYFPEFWHNRNGADCVFGLRRTRSDGFARTMTSNICRWGSSIVCRADLRDPNVPYRLIRRSVLKVALSYIPTGFNIHNVALTYILRKTPALKWRFVSINFRDRQGGSNSINVIKVCQWGAEMLLELTRLKTPK
jgi:dolichol-phosphate mannosyltransferase